MCFSMSQTLFSEKGNSEIYVAGQVPVKIRLSVKHSSRCPFGKPTKYAKKRLESNTSNIYNNLLKCIL